MNWDSLIPPLVGSFFGVITAFALNNEYQSYKTQQDKIRYIKMFRSEIELCIYIIQLDRIRLLPIDQWISAVNSGALKFFKVDTELQILTRGYYDIKDYNNRAVDFVDDDVRWSELESNKLFDIKSNREYLEIRKSLLKELKDLKDMEWMQLIIINADEAGAYMNIRAVD